MAERLESWCILELMGHVRVAGFVTEEEHFGVKIGRIDIPNGERRVTQFFGGSAVYRLTPCAEEIARAVAAEKGAAPIQPWEMPRLAALRRGEDDEGDEDDDEDEIDGRLDQVPY